MESEYYQIVIVGAGPAGCSTALWIARLRPELAGRILVLEKRRHPRGKACAGGLTAQAMLALADLGLTLDIPHVKINHVRLLFENYSLDIQRPGCMRVVRRDRFDAMLCEAVKAAGIQVREDEPVLGIRFSDGACLIETAAGLYRAGAVIGADGTRGLTHRLLPGYTRYSAVGLAVDTPECAGDGGDYDAGRVTVDFTCNAAGVPGYVWHFPYCENGTRGFNRGIYSCSLKPERKSGNLIPHLRNSLERRGLKADGPIRGGYGGGYYRRPLARPHLLLVGDAAGGNMLTGEGISQALRYGRIAAEEIVRASARRDFSFRSYTARLAASELGRELENARRFAARFYTKGPRVALSAMMGDDSLKSVVANYMTGARVNKGIRRDLLTRMLAASLKRGAPGFGTFWKILGSITGKIARI